MSGVTTDSGGKGLCAAQLQLCGAAHCQEWPLLLPWAIPPLPPPVNPHILWPSSWTPQHGTGFLLHLGYFSPPGHLVEGWHLGEHVLKLLLARDTELKLFNSCFISASHPYPHPNLGLGWASTPDARDISLQSPVRATTKAINFPAGSQYSLFI